MNSSENYADVDVSGLPQEEKHPAVPRAFTPEESEKIEQKRRQLASIAYFIGKDFEIPVELNEAGKGWHWDFKHNIIRVDPIDLLEKPEEYNRFVIAHEGGHRRITRTEFIPKEVWNETGFPFMMNAIEDPRMNNFVAEAYPRFREQMEFAYNLNLEEEEKVKREAPGKIGHTPKHLQAGFEYIKQWFRQAKGESFELSSDLPPDVREVVEKTLAAAEDSWFRYPSKREADKDEKLISRYAEKSYRINLEKVWPEFKKLVEADVKDQSLEQALKDMMKKSQEKQEKKEQEKEEGEQGKQGERESEEKEQNGEGSQKESDSKKSEAQGGKPEIPKKRKEKLTPVEAEALGKVLEESMQSGKPAPLDSLPPEIRQKIADHIDSLPEEEKAELRERAEEMLREFDEEINKTLQGMFEQEQGKEEGEEKKEAPQEKNPDEEKGLPPKSAEESKIEKESKPEKIPEAEPVRKKKADSKELQDAIRQALEGNRNIYEKYREEFLPIIDQLEEELREVFVQRRSQAWQAGFKNGKHIDIKRRIQEKAKDVPVMESRAWERRELPKEKDYAIELLVDLSGSMRGDKIEETFKAAIVLSEVLNRLSIQNEITGFNDRLHVFKSFSEAFSDDIRRKMGTMLEEVSSSRAAYNDDGWALEEAAKRLGRELEEEKFLIVLSDGVPEPSGAHSGSEFELRKVAERISKEGKEKLIGLGIGSGTEHVKEFYPNSIANVSVSEMAKRLADLLRDIVEHGDKY